MPAEPVGVLVIPYDRAGYQDALYGTMSVLPEADVSLAFWTRRRFTGVWPLFVLSAWYRGRGYRIAHIHWPAFYLARSMRWKACSYLLNRLVLLWLVWLGYHIVWTVHNVIPHEPQTSDDRSIAIEMTRRASALICHSRSSVDELAGIGGRTNRSIVIPHGNYIGWYPPSDEDYREQRGIASGTRVFLFFGKVRPYKGLDSLIGNIDCLGPSDQLWVVGEGLGADSEQSFHSSDPRLHRMDRHVPDAEVEAWMLGADVVCLPFKAITTSGSAVLALSFGKPIVAPRLGALRELPPDVGFFYEAGDPDGLASALRAASSAEPSQLEVMSRAARALAEEWSWDRISRETWAVYTNIVRC